MKANNKMNQLVFKKTVL